MSPARLKSLLLLRVAGRAPLFLQGIGQPAVVALLVLVDEQTALHLVVAPAAQLGAGQFPDLVVALLVLLVSPPLPCDPLAVEVVRPEPDRDHLARNGILFKTQ